MPSSLDNAVDHLAAAEIANPYQPSKPAKPLPPHGPFLVALLVAIGGWSASLAWMASLASDLSAIVAPIAVGGGALLASVLLFLLAAHLSLRASAVLRHEAETARNLAAREMTRQKVYQEKLDQLGSSHDTMYALLFKSRRLSNARVLEEDYVVRDYLLSAPDARVVSVDAIGDPQRIFGEALEGMEYDATAATRAASSIRDPGYGLRSFCVDVRQAFPELSLYVVRRETALEGHTDITSGVTAEAEYRRTIGALFAVYWIARIGIDGALGFSFGVDDNWSPRTAPNPRADSNEQKKRQDFHDVQDWPLLQKLLVDAGCLVHDSTAEGGLGVDVERMRTMLALTAIHDVFKVDALLPKIERQTLHGGVGLLSGGTTPFTFEGFKVGDVVNDHDIALSYVLEYFPNSMPSFAALSADQQRTIKFTQGKMGFNHGWLVQGEAPPGALFSRFKQVIKEGGAQKSDVAFYFAHWLTDVAGAVPSPLEGSEKFVLQFPSAVLGSFIKSFGVIHELAQKSETEVYENYLEQQWREASDAARTLGAAEKALHPSLGQALQMLSSPPDGEGAVALMRLITQTQMPASQLRIAAAFHELGPDDRKVLSEEMARTGIHGQSYKKSGNERKPGGPAILVYYSPAFVRSLAMADKPLAALRLLAEVYRRARVLWPLTSLDASGTAGALQKNNVTVRIDQIKGLSLEEIHSVYASGNSWLILKRNEQEAIVECHTIDFMAELLQQGTRCAVLKFYRRKRKGDGGGGSSASSHYDSCSSHGSHTPCSDWSGGSGAGAMSPDVLNRDDDDSPALMRAEDMAPAGAPAGGVLGALSGLFTGKHEGAPAPRAAASLDA